MEAATQEKPRTREMQPQPLEIVNIPGARLNVRTVEILVGRSKSWIIKAIKAGEFPPPIRVTPRLSDYLSDDIRAYLQATKRGDKWKPGPCSN